MMSIPLPVQNKAFVKVQKETRDWGKKELNIDTNSAFHEKHIPPGVANA